MAVCVAGSAGLIRDAAEGVARRAPGGPSEAEPGADAGPAAPRGAALMLRLGHASAAAANRYLHAVDGRDAEVAAALSELAVRGDAAKLPKSIVTKH